MPGNADEESMQYCRQAGAGKISHREHEATENDIWNKKLSPSSSLSAVIEMTCRPATIRCLYRPKTSRRNSAQRSGAALKIWHLGYIPESNTKYTLIHFYPGCKVYA